ncbi:MAG: bifunctional DNA-formamidopyrimidine glycosylase/DNA-(apurinic or apyrimidinic site) lyase [Hyphomicrobiaceae bacterium]
MPELPEVETVCRGLGPVMEGATFRDVALRRPDLRFPFPSGFADRVRGTRLTRLTRRAKYLLGRLSSGDVLVMHLGMSGRFSIQWPSADAFRPGAFKQSFQNLSTHDHVIFEMSSGAAIVYNDTRRFGFMDLIHESALESCRHFVGMGVEPLSNAFNGDYVARRAARRTSNVKAFLLDQRHVAGLGNIYVCEALFRAGISPLRKTCSLAKANGRPTSRVDRLVPAIRSVLGEAIAAGGSTLRDFAAADGDLGYFQHAFQVYGRDGEPCVHDNCSGTVRRVIQAGRATFYCATCQR